MTGIAEFHAEVSAHNSGYLKPGVEITPWNARMMETTDPFGNRIRFSEDIKS